MEKKQYRLSYLPLFYDDLLKAIRYISVDLGNTQAADDLLDLTETAILERLNAPESFEKYSSSRERTYPYYRIYVRNYTVYYVVIPDGTDKHLATMEVRRFLYNKRDNKTLV